MRYVVLFPQAENVHLIKDVGMIPYKLQQRFDVPAVVACYENDHYDYLPKTVKGLELEFIKRKYQNSILDGSHYLHENARNIDILQIFHLTLSSVLYTIIYKHHNPGGKVFLKLDCSSQLIAKLANLNRVSYRLLNWFLAKVNVIGIEQEQLYTRLKDLLPQHVTKILLLPNGVDFTYLEDHNINYDYRAKQNIILHVARLGSPEKNSKLLLQSFRQIEGIAQSGWRLVLVGPMTGDFAEYLHIFQQENPHLKSIIDVKGPIQDREQLFQEYRKAKIFCLTSNFESFGIALIEAAALGDIIVATDVGIANELVMQGNGAVVAVDDPERFAAKLAEFINKEDTELELLSQQTWKICRDKFNWDDIVVKLWAALADRSGA